MSGRGFDRCLKPCVPARSVPVIRAVTLNVERVNGQVVRGNVSPGAHPVEVALHLLSGTVVELGGVAELLRDRGTGGQSYKRQRKREKAHVTGLPLCPVSPMASSGNGCPRAPLFPTTGR